MDMHILEIKSDGKIFGVIRIFPLDSEDEADVNNDSTVNAKDALLIQRYAVGLKNTGVTGTSAEQ